MLLVQRLKDSHDGPCTSVTKLERLYNKLGHDSKAQYDAMKLEIR